MRRIVRLYPAAWRERLPAGDLKGACAMAWRIESTRDIAATPATIWHYYTDPATWPTWAHNTAAAGCQGPLAVGSEVRVEPKRGRQTIAVRIAAPEPEKRLVSETRLPGVIMRFGYLSRPLLASACATR